ncbi:response regulator [Dokdonella koreensis]|uniref:histidine kinase n=1 Tax=Dokdonella koreensis DS-123 TaxID=1300342 RepID=A0A160DWB6_9GAMM|nr:response regulator [Dokdonella koreensis]ANB18530.1 Signal transduction histidine kinase [Dokdonella koreensis DS-123]
MKRGIGTWLADLPISAKTLLGFGLVLATFVVTCLIVLFTLGRAEEVRELRQQSVATIEQVLVTTRLMREEEVALKNHVLVGGPEQETAYREADRRFKEQVRTLALTVADNAAQTQDVQRVAQLERDWTAASDAIVAGLPASDSERARYVQDVGRSAIAALSQTVAPIMEGLDAVLDAERAQLQTRTTDQNRLEQLTHLILFAMLALGLIVGWAAVRLSTRLLARPVSDLTERMSRLAANDLAVEVPSQERRDEVGAIARALEVFKQAAIAMRDQSWVKTRAAEITAALPEAATQQAFADTLMSQLSTQIGAGVGVFYLLSQPDLDVRPDAAPTLELLGSYGFRQRKHLQTRCAIGEGLVGQCALERKTIVLEPVPEDYIRIHSGLGEAPPRSVIVLPLLLRTELLGVLEFGSFQRFTPVQQALLDDLLPVVALSLDNLRRALRTQDLLGRTQAQARELQASEEELRMQQEELAATNEELQGKTVELEEHSQRLRASEEELRVQAEELQASNEELRQKTDTLNEQKKVLEVLQQETLQKADELARASQYKSDFLANMSHELRTPLNSLLILSRTLADNEQGNLSVDEVESARVIHESGSNLLRLINDILDLSKIEAGKMEVSREDIRLAGFAQSLQRQFRPMAIEKALEFEIVVGPDLPETIHTDGPKLEQIANNLLGNAFKFTRVGHVRVRIEPAGDALLARAGMVGPAVALAVDDTGIGIAPDQLDRMFQVFEQADASTSRHYGGSGLGLAITRRLTDLLGGGILVDSVPGEGSTFVVVLPQAVAADEVARAPEPVAHPAPARVAAPPRRPAPAPLPAPSVPSAAEWIPDDRDLIRPGDTAILAIEDDPAFARILVDLIRRKGHRALAAGDGESGLDLVRRYRPTGVLLDVMLPGMDGWGVIEQMKADPDLRAIPVHFISAVDESARGEALGAVGFLTKPADRKAVLSAFDRLLQHAEHRVRRVLLVDDDEDSRLAIIRLIAHDGVEVVEAMSGEEGLDMLGAGGFDCVVLDLGLPGISGFDFLDIAAGRGGLPPVVIYSARELSSEESVRLRQHTDSIVIKGARSNERLLDEVSLFMHSIRPAGNGVVRDIDAGLSGQTVLIVDDDMRNIFALSKTLRARGLNVVMAQDGHKALRQVEENPAIDIVLMDIMMPGMDGYETMRRIRALPRHAKLPIIAVTAKAMQGDRDKCLDAGASDYLAKPVDIDKLLSMMRVWLQA